MSSIIWMETEVSVPFRSRGELDPLNVMFPRPSSPVTVMTRAVPFGTENVVSRLCVLELIGIAWEIVVISEAVTVMVMFLTTDGIGAVSGRPNNDFFWAGSVVPILRVTFVALPDFPPPEHDVIKIMARTIKPALKYADFIDSSIC
jgi:hypothetical protein